MGSERRDEWVRLMIELASLDRDVYREIRAEAWRCVERNHAAKSPEQLAAWVEGSS